DGTLILDEHGRFVNEIGILGDPFTVALDYLTILLHDPKHKLPAIILVSPENITGKTTFIKFLRILFGSNVVHLGIEQSNMRFNSHYITKFIVGLDEGLIDKKAEKERLKMLITADEAWLEFKGMNLIRISFHAKFVACSNEADSFLQMDQNDSRWF